MATEDKMEEAIFRDRRSTASEEESYFAEKKGHQVSFGKKIKDFFVRCA